LRARSRPCRSGRHVRGRVEVALAARGVPAAGGGDLCAGVGGKWLLLRLSGRLAPGYLTPPWACSSGCSRWPCSRGTRRPGRAPEVTLVFWSMTPSADTSAARGPPAPFATPRRARSAGGRRNDRSGPAAPGLNCRYARRPLSLAILRATTLWRVPVPRRPAPVAAESERSTHFRGHPPAESARRRARRRPRSPAGPSRRRPWRRGCRLRRAAARSLRSLRHRQLYQRCSERSWRRRAGAAAAAARCHGAARRHRDHAAARSKRGPAIYQLVAPLCASRLTSSSASCCIT
jgi:hypothetical protein